MINLISANATGPNYDLKKVIYITLFFTVCYVCAHFLIVCTSTSKSFTRRLKIKSLNCEVWTCPLDFATSSVYLQLEHQVFNQRCVGGFIYLGLFLHISHAISWQSNSTVLLTCCTQCGAETRLWWQSLPYWQCNKYVNITLAKNQFSLIATRKHNADYAGLSVAQSHSPSV